jgi:hypothetical protein
MLYGIQFSDIEKKKRIQKFLNISAKSKDIAAGEFLFNLLEDQIIKQEKFLLQGEKE